MLFCDLVNSTGLAAQLDPEEWRDRRRYHRAAAQAIERFGGHVAQYLGDGVMAYFGYPEAHDNDAERPARRGAIAKRGAALWLASSLDETAIQSIERIGVGESKRKSPPKRQ